MSDHDPDDLVAVVRSIYVPELVGEVFQRFADDITLDQDPRLPWGGHYVGRDGAVEFFVKLATHVDTTVETESVFRAGDEVVQHGRSRGTVRHNGAPLDVPECHIWTFRDGLIRAARFYIDSDAVLAAMAIDPERGSPTPID